MLEAVEVTEKKRVFQVDKLVWARKQMGISQGELARRLGIPADHYNRFERGRHQPSLDLMVRMAQVLDISTDYLLGVSDQPEGPTPRPLTPTQEALLRIERAEMEIAAARKAIKAIK